MAYTIKAWPAFKNYQNTCYRNYLYASEGLRCMGSTWSPLAPLKGLGEDVYLIGGEPHAASTAGTFPEEAVRISSPLKLQAWAFTRAAT